jgi:hypothetical protein
VEPTTRDGVWEGAGGGTPLLGILLAAAMFVFVIDTSLMNVSISAVVDDLDTTVSAVQAAVAVEALVRGGAALGGLVWLLVRRRRAGKPTLLDPGLFSSKLFSVGVRSSSSSSSPSAGC